MSNEELVNIIRFGKDTDGYRMLQLYEKNLGIFHKIFNSLNLPKDIEEDAEQEFFLWLSDAVNNFDSDLNTLFVSYLSECLKGRLIRFSHEQSSCRLSEDRHYKILNYERQKQKLIQILNREPTNKELSAFMGIRIHELIRIKHDSQNKITTSLNDEVGEGTERIELIADSKDYIQEAEDRLDIEYRNKELWRVVLNESEYDKQSITEYFSGSYKGDKRLLRQDIYKCVQRLKNNPGKTRKLSLLLDIDCIRNKSVSAFQRDHSSIVEDIVFYKMHKEEMYLKEREVFQMNHAEYKTKELAKCKSNEKKCCRCGKPGAEKRAFKESAYVKYISRGIIPSSRETMLLCDECFARERRTNGIAMEVVTKDGTKNIVEYR